MKIAVKLGIHFALSSSLTAGICINVLYFSKLLSCSFSKRSNDHYALLNPSPIQRTVTSN